MIVATALSPEATLAMWREKTPTVPQFSRTVEAFVPGLFSGPARLVYYFASDSEITDAAALDYLQEKVAPRCRLAASW